MRNDLGSSTLETIAGVISPALGTTVGVLEPMVQAEIERRFQEAVMAAAVRLVVIGFMVWLAYSSLQGQSRKKGR